MKNIFILSMLAIGLAGCETHQHNVYDPYPGTRGDYGFTFDLDNAPSPFEDTAYRPLTAYDLAAPIVVVVTNQPPPRIIYKEAPEIGVTRYSGETPARTAVVTAGTQVNEAAGAEANRGLAGAGTAGAAPTVAPGAVYYGGSSDGVFSPGTNLVTNAGTNTNAVVTNAPTNISATVITNTNAFGFVQTNIAEPAGTQLVTNRPPGQPSGTQLRTNRLPSEPALPPRSAGTNRALLNSTTPTDQTSAAQNPVPAQNTVQAPVPPPNSVAQPERVQTAPIQRPVQRPSVQAPSTP